MTASFSKGRMLISKVKLSFWYYMIKLLFVFSFMHFCGVCFSHDLFSSEMAGTLSIGYVSFTFYDHSWILSNMKLRTHCWRSIPGTHLIPEKYPLWGWGAGDDTSWFHKKRVWSSPFLDPLDLAYVCLHLDSSDLYILKYISSHEQSTFLSSVTVELWTVCLGLNPQFWKSILNPDGWYQNCIAILWSIRHVNTH